MKTQFSRRLRVFPVFLTTAFCLVACRSPTHSLYQDIHAAARAGDLDSVAADLEQRPDELELPDDAGFTPLHLAAAYCQTNVVALLLRKGARPDVRANDGATPLQEAAQQGCAAGVALLLENGATVNLRNSRGKTALGCAEAFKQDAIVQLLRQHGGAE